MIHKKISGIQKKYLSYTLALFILALFLSSIGVWAYVRNNMTRVIVDKYGFMNEKLGISLDSLYQKSDEVTAECIMDNDVQKSLRAEELQDVQRNALSKYFAYIDLNHVSEYCYVDNKKHVYTKSYSKITYEDFENSKFATMLSEKYSKTEWFWTKDTLFHTGEEALFVGRYVRSMDYSHKPGMIFLKMDQQFLENLFGKNENHTIDAAVGIVDKNGNFCLERYPQGFSINDTVRKKIVSLTQSEDYGVILKGYQTAGGILQVYRQQESGMLVFTLVPNTILYKELNQILLVLVGIYFLVILVTVVTSLYISKIFTEPIQKLSAAMENFDGKDFNHKIELHTNTELDNIGHSYNEMLNNIEQLLIEIKNQEKELRTSELNMLINQINPHFLYNTLDTIYMLARINGEETTMKMIQALSKYLRLSLSKGHEIVTVADELENVKSYMEIQQIRNDDLFCYEINCNVNAKERWVLKLILQPLVENAIKYGFCDISEGGLIRIDVQEQAQKLTFMIYNSGSPMQQENPDKLNWLAKVPVADMKQFFPDKQHGYGVINIITRLRLKYGEEVKYEYEIHKNGTTCIIQLPENGVENDEL